MENKIKILGITIGAIVGLYFLYINFQINGVTSGIYTILTLIGGWIIFTQIKRASNKFQNIFLTTLILFFSAMFILYKGSNESIAFFYLLGIVTPLLILIKPQTNKLLKNYLFKDYLLGVIRGIIIAIAIISFLGFLLGDFKL